MILVDTSVWIDHIRGDDARLAELLRRRLVVSHPFVIGELALGGLRDRKAFLANIRALPGSVVATDREVLALIENHRLYGRGIGYVDAHLIASALLAPGTTLWTRDRTLAALAAELGAGDRLT